MSEFRNPYRRKEAEPVLTQAQMQVIARAMGELIVKHVKPLRDRVATLEKTLEHAQADAEAALEKHADEFTLDDLERMARNAK
ncbi:hypothetical protein [Shimia aestuarii]|uniref:Uncharacterized protein n=1 Tax=Shimia aestuarii TaxID=254406 RepID=A0A1I4N6T9_9RHOB|nr:hypothetical protein [Shimia aestuarii]SFM11095.1 hypothetical protein SAMN04488042_10412 [Shimia aestuarii]